MACTFNIVLFVCLIQLNVFYGKKLYSVDPMSVLLPCVTDDECEGAARCNGDGLCKCPDGSWDCDTDLPDWSTFVTKLGEHCITNKQCNIANAWCDPEKGICKCRSDSVPSTSRKSCYPIQSALGDYCNEDAQCNTTMQSAVCFVGVCACPQKMHAVNNSCFDSIELSGTCKYDGECWITPNARCVEQRCACAARYTEAVDAHVSRPVCALAATSQLSPCEYNEQCTVTLGAGSECQQGYCNCQYLYQYKAKLNRCVRDHTLGDDCTSHDQCHQPGDGATRLICLEGECKCKAPQYFEEKEYCVEVSSAVHVMSNAGFLVCIAVLAAALTF